MKTILCYGDSNTYGYRPDTGGRYPADIRWTGVLAELLGKEYRIIEEGCNGRTTVFDDPMEGWKNGRDYLKPCLHSHRPVDMVILMLGSNDLKEVFHASVKEIIRGVETLVDIILQFTKEKQGYQPRIILVSPPQIGEEIEKGSFGDAFTVSAVERSKEFPAYYEELAGRKNCIFLDAAKIVTASELDSLHLSPEAHGRLAEALAKVITKTGIEAGNNNTK